MISDLVESEILNKKSKSEVLTKLGKPTYSENDSTLLVYEMGPYYPDDYGPYVLFIKFKDKQVDTLYYYQP